jgi:hypothetical protein
MRWKLFGIIPLVNAPGPDITRSAAGRIKIESIWLPPVLARDGVLWTKSDTGQPHARLSAHGEPAELDLTVDESGWLKSVNMPRWGNPHRRELQYVKSGGFADRERNFSGYTVPTRMRGLGGISEPSSLPTKESFSSDHRRCCLLLICDPNHNPLWRPSWPGFCSRSKLTSRN